LGGGLTRGAAPAYRASGLFRTVCGMLEMFRIVFHLALHVLVPAALAHGVYRKDRVLAFGVMMLTMAVDLDHLLAVPVFDPCRCSLGFHPLHNTIPVVLYACLAVLQRHRITRWIGQGLIIHMALDGIDCLMMGLG